MKRFFCSLAVSVLCLQAPASAQNYYETEEEGEVYLNIAVTPAVTMSYPVFDFGENYLLNFGGGLKTSLNMDALNGKIGWNLGLLWYTDQFKVREQDAKGSFTTIAANLDFYVFYLTSGASIGSGCFRVSDDVYEKFGNSTGTELKWENKMWQLTSSRYFGLRVPLGDRVAVDLNYHLITADRAWMFWHSMISGAIKEISIMPFDAIANKLAEKDKIPAAILMKLAGAGVSWAWYYFDYKHHNWPWNDGKPLRYQRFAIGTTILLGHWSGN